MWCCGCGWIKNKRTTVSQRSPTTQHGVLVRAVGAVLVGVAQVVGAGAVPVAALELPQSAVAAGAGGRLVGPVPAVPLAVTPPPDGDTPETHTGTVTPHPDGIHLRHTQIQSHLRQMGYT